MADEAVTPPPSEWKVYRVAITSGVSYSRDVLAPSKEAAEEAVQQAIYASDDWAMYDQGENYDGGFVDVGESGTDVPTAPIENDEPDFTCEEPTGDPADKPCPHGNVRIDNGVGSCADCGVPL